MVRDGTENVISGFLDPDENKYDGKVLGNLGTEKLLVPSGSAEYQIWQMWKLLTRGFLIVVLLTFRMG